jgi:hypothetical protein
MEDLESRARVRQTVGRDRGWENSGSVFVSVRDGMQGKVGLRK